MRQPPRQCVTCGQTRGEQRQYFWQRSDECPRCYRKRAVRERRALQALPPKAEAKR